MTSNKKDVDTIKRLSEEWRAGWHTGDIDALLSLYADVPILMPQNHPAVMGRGMAKW